MTMHLTSRARLAALAAAGFALAAPAQAALITFDDLVSGVTSYSYDGDSDSIADVVFSTTDAAGFNTVGPGPNQSYINEPGIEGTTLLPVDLRVTFLLGANTSLGFGFAMNGTAGASFVTFSIFDINNLLLASGMVTADYTDPPGASTQSSFPEGLVNIAFAGTAAYATFNFTGGSSRYIIDNFTGTFGSTEVPEPGSLALAGLALAGLGASRLRRR